MWTALISRFWPYLLGAALIVGAGWYLCHSIYESGRSDERAHWKPLFDAAETERAKAEARADTQEAQSKILSATREAQHAELVASLTLRVDAAQRTNTDLVRKLTAAARSRQVPEGSRPASEPDEATSGAELADRVGNDLTRLAGRCESDATQLALLQGWVRDQLALQR